MRNSATRTSVFTKTVFAMNRHGVCMSGPFGMPASLARIVIESRSTASATRRDIANSTATSIGVVGTPEIADQWTPVSDAPNR